MYAGSDLGDAGNRDGPRLEARFNSPRSLALDGNGVLLVADTLNGQIRMIADNQVSLFAGVGGDGPPQDGPAKLARFDRLTDIAIDHNGNVLVADYTDDELRVVRDTGLQPPLQILEKHLAAAIVEKAFAICEATTGLDARSGVDGCKVMIETALLTTQGGALKLNPHGRLV